MLGLQSGFRTRVKERIPSVITTHCILHGEDLASKTLPDEMRDVLNLAIKVVMLKGTQHSIKTATQFVFRSRIPTFLYGLITK